MKKGLGDYTWDGHKFQGPDIDWRVENKKRVRRRHVSERSIEESNRSWALRAYGNALREPGGRLIIRKMNAYPDRHWPDRLFIGRGSRGPTVFFIEYKAPGEEPTPMQAQFHRVLRRLRIPIEVAEGKEQGQAIIRKYMGPEPALEDDDV